MPIKLAKKLKTKTNLANPTRVYKGLKTSNWGKAEWMRLTVFLFVSGAIGYITFNTFAASNIAHPDGALVTFAGGHVYLIEGGHKRPVVSENALYTNGYNFGMVVPASAADATLADGPPLGLRAGTLIRAAGTGVWAVVDSGNGNYTKWGIPNETVFYGLGYNYNQVVTVSANELPPDSPNYITGNNHPGGQFVAGTDGIVYMIGSAGKYRVADPGVLATYPFALYAATAGDMALPTLGFLPYHEGSLVVSPGGTVYMMGCADASGAQGVCNMQKHGFTDQNTFTSLGYNSGMAVGGTDGNLNAITTGANVTDPGAQAPCLPSSTQCNPTPAPPPVVSPTAPPPTPAPTPTPPPASNAGTDPSGSLDSPTNTSYPYPILAVGSIVNGWAADKETAIHGVQIYIDGNLVSGGANATLGYARSDACAGTRLNWPGCPNVGWQFTLSAANTANLAPGTHTIHFVATDNDIPSPHHYTSVDRNFTFGNTNPNNPPAPAPTPTPTPPATGPNPTTPCLPSSSQCNPNAVWKKPSGNIDTPAAGSRVGGVISVGGWAIDNTSAAETKIKSVTWSIDGHYQGDATTGLARSDVCKVYPGRVGCPNVGWQFYWNTAAWVNGNHEIEVTIADSDPTGSHSTTIARVVATNNDLPPSGVITSPITKSIKEKVMIKGWAFDNTVKPEHEISSVRISVNNVVVGYAEYGLLTDSDQQPLCKRYQNPPGCPYIGWQFPLDTRQYANGSTLNVKATITDADSPPSTTTLGATYIVKNTDCPVGQTGTPPNCITPPPTPTPTPPPTATGSLKVIYAYPSEASPVPREVGGIPAGIYNFQKWLKNQSTGVLTSAPKGVQVNISNPTNIIQYRLPRTTAQYKAAAGYTPNHTVNIGQALYDQVIGDLSAKYPASSTQQYLVYIDGVYPDTACGRGGAGYATFWLQSSAYQDPSDQTPPLQCQDTASDSTVGGPMSTSSFANLAPLHEIFHNLGLVSTCAPNYDTNPSHPNGHIKDEDDLMHYNIIDNPVLDINHDDYYGNNLAAGCLGLTDPSAMAFFNIL